MSEAGPERIAAAGAENAAPTGAPSPTGPERSGTPDEPGAPANPSAQGGSGRPGDPAAPGGSGTPTGSAPHSTGSSARPDADRSTPRPRRRQARGEARIAQLLAAAADVFRTQGYTAASTNAIAREAGVSPGTLYQFFPNKEAIAVELGDRLLHRWQETYGEAITQSHTELALDRMLDRALDPLIAFNTENPAFCVLMLGGEAPGRLTEKHDLVHDAMFTRVKALLAGYLPELPAAQIQRVATMVFQLFKGGIDLILAHEDEEREAYARELKTVMFRYLRPLLDEANHLSRGCGPA
ncbi:TetR family transcriptional regulator [Streptomyces sp. AM 2-1-1]|uniref:TetR/AcrR family transcriptional regulator n=1 Tax=Streptomyces sp. AM 2-1-1 TaxID=3028709 RepID=UPI0023B93F63|nr:TetR family transcriptional regulator [Streptomyces sp. AM 2-1-1]WEH41748.1 TetR family transcriptional regulator [Streptomyces sp. AM 2-1-1]